MKTAHTPGPWTLDNERVHGRGAEYADEGSTAPVICTMATDADRPSEYMGAAERKANAALIAAAPDLLAALESIAVGASPASIEVHHRLGTLFHLGAEIESIARAAIAKATGGAQ